MIRLLVIAVACYGISTLLSHIWPSLGAVAFTVVGYGISWLALATVGFGILTYRVTK